jgi:hypothetical protein
MTTDLRYPVGKFVRPTKELTSAERATMMDQITAAPAAFRAAVKGLNEKQLDSPYRPDGWMVRQVVHHVADSHMNAFIRCKLALTEDAPMVKPYDEAAWAQLPDSLSPYVQESLTMIELVHQRWMLVMRAMKPADFLRPYRHPEWEGTLTLDFIVAQYSWHGRHHAAHITELRKRNGW